jgi:2-polyprenyl-3-methyl-5-hydroxy-6-metoxy-1,4-benzoquinol methylase
MGLLSPLFRKLINPVEVYRIVKLQRNRKKVERVRDDAQLKLYSEILKGDFLHYGYFDDPDIKPEDISLNHIYKAQLRYAELLVEQLNPNGKQVLDIGCGMGGLIKLLQDKGYTPTALTPDNTQAHYITNKYPGVTLLHSKFEDMDGEANRGKFDALITSESLQYLDLDKALPLLHKISKPDAKWIACDYFRTGDKAEKSGHKWEVFLEKLAAYGWKLEYERDITPNILPTIAYVYMWGNNIGLPLYNFAVEKLHVKSPGIFYAVEGVLPGVKQKIDKNLLTVNPKVFAENKRYKLMTFRKA